MQIRELIILPQWLAGLGVTLLMLQLGLMAGWSSPSLARLTSPESEIPLDLNQASWVASLVNVSRFFGSIIGAIATNYLGSKKSIFVTAVPMATAWLIIALANRVEWLYVARLSSGLGLGMAYSSFPLYIGEVSMPEIRGALMSLASCGVTTGQILASVFGSYLSITLAAWIYLSCAVLIMCIFLWLPESPHHLVSIGQREAAKKSINWYRAGKGVDKELEAVELFVNSSRSSGFMDKIKEYRKPAIRKATFQVTALFAFFQVCGIMGILSYMELILRNGGFQLLDPALVVIYVNICGLLATFTSTFLIDSCGRRFLLLLSSSGMTISLVALMGHFLLIEANVNIEKIQWLPAVSIFSFIISYFLGMLTVPSTVLSEMFPTNIKCIAACIAGLTAAISSFVALKVYQPVVDVFGNSYIFLFYAVCSFLIIPYTIFIMPETKGKSLQQIQDELIKKH